MERLEVRPKLSEASILLDMLEARREEGREELSRRIAIAKKAFAAAADGTKGFKGEGRLISGGPRRYEATDLVAIDEARSIYLEERLARDGENVEDDNVVDLRLVVDGGYPNIIATFTRQGKIKVTHIEKPDPADLGVLEALVETIAASEYK